MTGTAADVLTARAKAAAARQRIDDNIGLLRNRIDPRVRAREALFSLRGRGEVLGDDAVEFVHERPGAIAIASGAIILFFMRHPLARLARWVTPRSRPKWDTGKSRISAADRVNPKNQ